MAWKCLLLAGLLVAARYGGMRLAAHVTPFLPYGAEAGLNPMILSALGVYVLLMMLPFVPGVEIGLALMAAFGPPVAPLVYAGTVLALLLAFLLGRILPEHTIVAAFEFVGLRRAAAMFRDLEALPTDDRLDFIARNAGSRRLPVLLRYRALALMVALNLPGNSVIGGGGGISLAAGMCRLFRPAGFLLAVAVAVAPVPLVFYFAG